jgi:Holliday junction DNA helicase RuvA
MIAYIEGKVIYKDPALVILETGGIGYNIRISLSTYAILKDAEKCKLHTVLSIKEDAHSLYGFYEPNEKKVFLLLTSISGVGPSTALMVLSSLSVREIEIAILDEDVKLIQSVKGIGLKTAQRIILELKDKVKKEGLGNGQGGVQSGITHNTVKSEALSALQTLGIAKNVAEKTIDQLIKNDNNITLENLIRQALKTA